MIYEYLELTRVFAVPYVCGCGVIWRLIVLGVQRLRAGAMAFCGTGKGRGAMLGVRFCDVVVTPCDVPRLEMALAQIDPLLLLCLG